MKESSWIEAMQEEIHKFERLKVWKLVLKPSNVMLIKLKWIFKVKLDEYGGVLKNKVRLVAKGCRQENEIYFEESFTPVARIEAFTSSSPIGIFINQSKYALEMLKKYDLENSDVVNTPMVERAKLDEDTQGNQVDPTRFRSMFGSLMYLTSSHPDLVFDVCMCARYLAKPSEKHLTAVK
ncbi:uncharacterized mitochondrial protein-like protein [Tanacetum coccineum]